MWWNRWSIELFIELNDFVHNILTDIDVNILILISRKWLKKNECKYLPWGQTSIVSIICTICAVNTNWSMCCSFKPPVGIRIICLFELVDVIPAVGVASSSSSSSQYSTGSEKHSCTSKWNISISRNEGVSCNFFSPFSSTKAGIKENIHLKKNFAHLFCNTLNGFTWRHIRTPGCS